MLAGRVYRAGKGDGKDDVKMFGSVDASSTRVPYPPSEGWISEVSKFPGFPTQGRMEQGIWKYSKSSENLCPSALGEVAIPTPDLQPEMSQSCQSSAKDCLR